MRHQTETNIREAFAGESQAHMKYLVYSARALEEGKSNIARLFRAIAFAEQIHASNHFRILGELADTVTNLKNALNGEILEVEEMYPAFMAVAKEQGEATAQASITGAMEAEKTHANFYHSAIEAAEAGGDLTLGRIHVCQVCGHTGEGDVPDRCPICGAAAERFRLFD